MKKAGTIVLAAALAAAGFAAGRLAPAAGGPAPAAGGRRLLHYACPMHPAVKAGAPGTAPCCGMALEPVYEDGGHAAAGAAPGTVTMSAELRQLQGVRVGTAERAPGKQTLRLFGRVVPDETRVHVVSGAFESTVREVSGAATTGSLVRRGERLGSFFSADIRTALQSYVTALDVIARDERSRVEAGLVVPKGATPSSAAEFVAERLRSYGVSPQQIAELARTNEIPVLVDVRSPVEGLVVARDFYPGRRTDPGTEWFRIANLDRVWILADVPQADAELVRPGATARVALPGRPPTLAAVVSGVPPRFDPASQTLKVRLELANPGAVLRPEMYVDVELEAERPEALTVPADALLDAGVRKTVFVEVSEGRFEPRQVETGWRAAGRVEIVRGLSAGERIVVSGTFMVDSESQLRAAASGAPAAPPGAVASADPGSAERPVDPVCGMTVDAATAEAAGRTRVHAGRTYHFCADECRARFAADPVRFAGHGPPGARRHDAR
jgi:Cu(I)/Ag(I) efflux system membrane fusion protein